MAGEKPDPREERGWCALRGEVEDIVRCGDSGRMMGLCSGFVLRAGQHFSNRPFGQVKESSLVMRPISLLRRARKLVGK